MVDFFDYFLPFYNGKSTPIMLICVIKVEFRLLIRWLFLHWKFLPWSSFARSANVPQVSFVLFNKFVFFNRFIP